MMIRRLTPLLICFTVFLVGAYALAPRPQSDATARPAHLAHLHGPVTPSTLPSFPVTTFHQYDQGNPTRLAILLTQTDSNWLGLAHGLKSIGVPFLITTDYQKAIRHRVILVYPILSGRVLSEQALAALRDHPVHGGTVIGGEIYGTPLLRLFGVHDMVPSTQHRTLHFTEQPGPTADLTDPKERTLRLGPVDPKRAPPIGTHHFHAPDTPPLAVYEDGTAAIVHQAIGTGHAYAFGIDLGFLLLKGHTLREEGIAASYNNQFEPMLDVFLRLLRAIYVAGEPDAVLLHSVPFNRAVTVLFTHDIDAQTSMANAVSYAQLERTHGITGTYFIQAKYLRDFNDDILLTPQAVVDLRRLSVMGMELGSHTVAHSKIFHTFPMGTGTEQYPEYAPFVHSRYHATGGSILGELRVSKFLIESLSHQPIVSFRPGELSNPTRLPQALAATGYRYSSSATANNSLTHLPYQLTVDRHTTTEAPVFEFPVTIEDEELPAMGDRIHSALTLTHRIARYGGLVCILIHPNILGHKYAFEEQFIAAVRPFAWFASVGQFGAWWAARNAIAIDVTTDRTLRHLTIQAPFPLEGLTLQVPPSWTLLQASTPEAIDSHTPGTVTLRRIDGTLTFTFRPTSPPTRTS